MSDQLIIDVPSSVASRYVVASDRRIDRPEEFTVGLLAANQAAGKTQLPGLLRQVIDTPMLSVGFHSADGSPCQADLARVTAPATARERLLSASAHLIIDSEASPADQPQVAQMVRTIARVLAEATDGQLADLCTAELISPEHGTGGERAWFRLADQWLAMDCLINPSADHIPPTLCSCLCLLTRGLARFGLPELVIEDLPCAYDHAATNLLRGLAVQLLTQLWHQPSTAQMRIEGSTAVTPEHIWGYWGARPQEGEAIAIAVANPTRPDLPPGRHLAVLPHPDFKGAINEWAAKILNQTMLAVARWSPDEPPYRIDKPPVPMSL